MTDIRVLIAEDQTLMRQGLRTILDLNDGFVVVGEAENGRAAEIVVEQVWGPSGSRPQTGS